MARCAKVYCTIYWAGYITKTYAVSAWMLPVSLLILGAAISAALPPQNLMLSALSAKGRKGTVFGTLMGVMTVANSLGPLFLGMIADRVGLTVTFRLAAAPVLLSCLLVIVVSRSKPVAALRLSSRNAGQPTSPR